MLRPTHLQSFLIIANGMDQDQAESRAGPTVVAIVGPALRPYWFDNSPSTCFYRNLILTCDVSSQ